jgi:CheY-like chemotaxis protein
MTERPSLVPGGWGCARPQSLRGLTVLVIDDHEDTLAMITEYLGWHGAAPIAATGVTEALAVLETASIDVVITDIAMPRYDGFALLGRMDANPHWAHIPRVIVSGQSFADELCEQIQGTICLSKPVALDELVRTVRKVHASALMKGTMMG